MGMDVNFVQFIALTYNHKVEPLPTVLSQSINHCILIFSRVWPLQADCDRVLGCQIMMAPLSEWYELTSRSCRQAQSK